MIGMDAHLSGHIVSEKRDRFRGFDAVVALLRCKTCTDDNHVKQPSTPVEILAAELPDAQRQNALAVV